MDWKIKLQYVIKQAFLEDDECSFSLGFGNLDFSELVITKNVLQVQIIFSRSILRL